MTQAYWLEVDDGRGVKIECGIDSIRPQIVDESVLIAVPISDDKLFCFSSFISGLKRLAENTKAKCTIAFAVNSEDQEILSAISRCGLPHIVVPYTRPCFDGDYMGYWMGSIVSARSALRQWALSYGFDWLFFLDADTAVEPETLNTLLSFGLDMSSVFYVHRIYVEDGYPNTLQVFQVAPKGKTTILTRILWEHAKEMPSPVFGAGGGFGTCLISNKLLSEVEIKQGIAPLVPMGQVGDLEEEGLLPEDIHFHHDACLAGYSFAQCHKTKSIHFISEYDYPRGYANTGELVTYEEYIGR